MLPRYLLAQNVGIGTPTPVNKLSVAGTVNVTDSLVIGTETPVNDLSVDGRINITGNLGIGIEIPPLLVTTFNRTFPK